MLNSPKKGLDWSLMMGDDCRDESVSDADKREMMKVEWQLNSLIALKLFAEGRREKGRREGKWEIVDTYSLLWHTDRGSIRGKVHREESPLSKGRYGDLHGQRGCRQSHHPTTQTKRARRCFPIEGVAT